MRKLVVFLLFAAAAPMWAQESFGTVTILPGGGVRLFNGAGTFYTGIEAASTVTANYMFRWPGADGPSGSFLSTDGAGNLGFANAGVPPPLYLSGGNVGVGCPTPAFVLDVCGAENLHGNLSLSADNTFNLFGPTLAPAATFLHNLNVDQRTVMGALVTQNAVSTPTWFITGGAGQTSGNSYWQDVTSRYVFNSAGDVAQTGTVNITSGGVVTSSVAVFDVSWAGGQLEVGSPPIPYTILSPVTSATSISLCTVASTTCLHPYAAGTQTGVGFSYLANAFQTSFGTLYDTGTGFRYGQSFSAAFGFTAYTTAGARIGTVSCSGTSAFQTGGAPFDLSMAGNTVTISGSPFVITSVTSTTQIGLNSACTSGGYSWTQRPFALDNDKFFVDINGTGFFNGGLATASSSSSIVYVGSVGNFYNRTFSGMPSCSGITDGWQGVDTTTPALWYCSGGTAHNAATGGGSAVSSVTGSGPGISISPTTGAVVVSNTGVTSLSASTGISFSGSAGSITATNTGVTSLTGGVAINVSGSTGGVTITNDGVTSLTNGGNMTFSGGPTGPITISTPQSVAPTASVTFANVTATNEIAVSNILTALDLTVNGLVDFGSSPSVILPIGFSLAGLISVTDSSGIFVIGAGAQASSFRVPGFVVVDASANVAGATVTTASHFAVNSTPGITSSTCSHWTGGICDTP